MKSINLTNIKILEMIIHPDVQNITVKYNIIDEFGEIYGREKVENYWVTLPSFASTQDNLLPSNYVTIVSNLYGDALNALKAKYL